MENSVGLFDAKTHLSSLVERVARGERITITKHGAPWRSWFPLIVAATQI